MPDENTFTLPSAWLRALHPRRGGTPVPPPRGSRAHLVPGLLAAAAPAIDRLRSGDGLPSAFRDAVRRYSDGEADAAGAALIAFAAVDGTDDDPYKVQRKGSAFVDRWRVEHGVGFAACALVELSRLAGADGRVVHHSGESMGHVGPDSARYVRRLLVAASDDDYADAVRRLSGLRTTPATRVLTAYLAPTRLDWADESVALGRNLALPPHGRRAMILASLGRAGQWGDPPPWRPRQGDLPGGLPATLLDGLGAAALEPLLAHLSVTTAAARRPLLEVIARIPTDAAFTALLERADEDGVRAVLPAMAARFPARASRLTAAADTGIARELLRIRSASACAVPEADPASLPEPLCGLPWDRLVAPVVPGLKPPAERALVWADGERAEWAAAAEELEEWPDGAPDWAKLVSLLRRGGDPVLEARTVVHGPDELVRPVLAEWDGPPAWLDGDWMKSVVARYGTDAYPVVYRTAKRSSWAHAAPLLPFLDADTAALMSGWLARGKKAAPIAREWCDGHGLDAVPFLAPAALGKRGAARRNAERMLRRIAARHGVDAVADAVPRAAQELRTVLSAHPAATRVHPRPELPAWADPAVLPRVLLRGRERALPPEGMLALVETLALPGTPWVEVVQEACDPVSLAESGLSLFECWRAAGMPPDGRWALMQLGRTGDDSAVPVLDPLVRSWTGRKRLPDAALALAALVNIGTDAALRAVHDLAVRWRTVWVRTVAAEVFALAAAARGLSAEVLGDRLVPDPGFDIDDGATVDYGRRCFTVRFDADLRPVVTDQHGKLRKSLPKPGKTDDPGLAPAAYEAFTGLRKRLETATSLQTVRLERAMTDGRRWTPAEFRDHALERPLVRRLARRLVWLAWEGDAATSFRIAEDGTFADAAEEAFEPSAAAVIGVAHPVLLGTELAAWVETFTDYEILQPFDQLGRPAFPLTDAERDGHVLDRFTGRTTTDAHAQTLAARGWTWNREQPSGGIDRFVRRVGDHRCIIVDTDARGLHGLAVRRVRAATGSGGEGFHAEPVRFGELDPVAVSEALADLTALTGGAP